MTSRVESATRVQWEELRRLPKQISSSSITIGSEVIFILILILHKNYILHRGEHDENGFRVFDAKVRKLRSRSCERVLRKCRGLGRAVHGKVNININTDICNTNTDEDVNTYL